MILVAMQLLQPFGYRAAIRERTLLTVYESMVLTHCVSQSIVTHHPVSKVTMPIRKGGACPSRVFKWPAKHPRDQTSKKKTHVSLPEWVSFHWHCEVVWQAKFARWLLSIACNCGLQPTQSIPESTVAYRTSDSCLHDSMITSFLSMAACYRMPLEVVLASSSKEGGAAYIHWISHMALGRIVCRHFNACSLT